MKRLEWTRRLRNVVLAFLPLWAGCSREPIAALPGRAPASERTSLVSSTAVPVAARSPNVRTVGYGEPRYADDSSRRADLAAPDSTGLRRLPPTSEASSAASEPAPRRTTYRLPTPSPTSIDDRRVRTEPRPLQDFDSPPPAYRDSYGDSYRDRDSYRMAADRRDVEPYAERETPSRREPPRYEDSPRFADTRDGERRYDDRRQEDRPYDDRRYADRRESPPREDAPLRRDRYDTDATERATPPANRPRFDERYERPSPDQPSVAPSRRDDRDRPPYEPRRDDERRQERDRSAPSDDYDRAYDRDRSRDDFADELYRRSPSRRVDSRYATARRDDDIRDDRRDDDVRESPPEAPYRGEPTRPAVDDRAKLPESPSAAPSAGPAAGATATVRSPEKASKSANDEQASSGGDKPAAPAAADPVTPPLEAPSVAPTETAPADATTTSSPAATAVEKALIPSLAVRPTTDRDARDAHGENLPAGPNPAIASVASRADQVARHAMTLARRGALYSARAEFIQSLRLIAQGLDAEAGGSEHSRQFAAGLKALEEADDFAPQGSRLEADLNLRAIVAMHRTPVLKNVAPETIQPVAALQAYYSFSQQQLAAAVGHEPAASLALFGLGKLHSAMREQPGQFGALSGPKALAFHQAALLVDGSNYRAANEMGVLLAKYGQLQHARQALQQSLTVCPMPETWHNLAIVHQRLGETTLAQQARYEHQLATSRGPQENPLNSPEFPVQWMPPTDFARNSPNQPDLWNANAAQMAARPQGPSGPHATPFAQPPFAQTAQPRTQQQMPMQPQMQMQSPQQAAPPTTAWNWWGTRNR